MNARRSGRMQLGGGGALPLAALLACICLPATPCRLTAAQGPAAAEPQLRAGSTLTPRRLVLCLDGTSNSDFDDKLRPSKKRPADSQAEKSSPGAGDSKLKPVSVLKPTNVLKVCRAVLPWDEAARREQITYYEIGVGSLTKYPGIANGLLFKTDRFLGGVEGAGFEANIESALSFLVLNYQPGDEVFVFGFSRGAATARGLTRFLDWTGGRLPAKSDAYYLPVFFHEFVVGQGKKSFDEAVKGVDVIRASDGLNPLDVTSFLTIRVHFLGVWDTVMALGSRFRSGGASTSTVSHTFLLEDQPAACVTNARQALAIDEARYDFRPEIWMRHRPGQSLKQRWFAGVHSNVGGGFVYDGMANVALQWMLDEAKEYGLAVDRSFIRHYRPFVYDTLYPEPSYYRLADLIRGRRGLGKRQLSGDEMSLDPSVIQRIQADPRADPKKFAKLEGQPYRPRNVFAFLACVPDLKQYLADLGVTTPLPADVAAQIQALRQDCAKTSARPSS
jgi:uncharacterized protein (DUF2235 family)